MHKAAVAARGEDVADVLEKMWGIGRNRVVIGVKGHPP